MVCGISCSIAIVFIVAMIYFYTASYTSQVAEKYQATLSSDKLQTYKKVVAERSKLAYQGYALGLLLSGFYLLLHRNRNIKLSNTSMICIVVAIMFLTNYFYYMLSPKKMYMLNVLNSREDIDNWTKMYRDMQINYHVGLLLGVIGAGFAAWAFKC